jgi:hypothetical protein
MKYALTLLAGLILGGVLCYFLLVGAPSATPLPGSPVKPPDPAGDPPGTAIVTLNEQFFETVLATIFRDLNAPAFPLQLTSMNGGLSGNLAIVRPASLQDGGCPDAVTLVQQNGGVKTGVRFVEGKLMAPLAFNGSYNAPFVGCVRFNGWAQANMRLRFDAGQQTVYGEITVEGVNLDGAPPVVGAVVTGLVQTAINQRVNPIEVLRAQQLTLAVPVKSSDGTLRAKVKDVRSEIKDNALRLHITYEFNGQRGQPQG